MSLQESYNSTLILTCHLSWDSNKKMPCCRKMLNLPVQLRYFCPLTTFVSVPLTIPSIPLLLSPASALGCKISKAFKITTQNNRTVITTYTSHLNSISNNKFTQLVLVANHITVVCVATKLYY